MRVNIAFILNPQMQAYIESGQLKTIDHHKNKREMPTLEEINCPPSKSDNCEVTLFISADRFLFRFKMFDVLPRAT